MSYVSGSHNFFKRTINSSIEHSYFLLVVADFCEMVNLGSNKVVDRMIFKDLKNDYRDRSEIAVLCAAAVGGVSPRQTSAKSWDELRF